MKKYKSKAEFIQSLGIDCTNAQGQYSFVNHEQRRVYFSLDLANGEDGTLILGDAWAFRSTQKKNGDKAKNPTYSKSIPHIALITDHQYDLYIFRTRTLRDQDGKTHATNEFDPIVEHRLLVREDDGWHAISLLPDSDWSSATLMSYEEGKVQVTLSNYYERNPKARQACLDHHGYQCKVCEFDFGKTYGERGEGFIHVHHINPLHTFKVKHVINPITDLIPVCPNCHAMLHAKGELIKPGELKSITREQLSQK